MERSFLVILVLNVLRSTQAFCNKTVSFQFINLISFKTKLKNSKTKQKSPNNTRQKLYGQAPALLFPLQWKKVIKFLMNYCLDDKKCHKDDALIPHRGVYLEIHGEVWDNRQRVNEVWEATLHLSGTNVNEKQLKLMRNESGFTTVFKATFQTPSVGNIPGDRHKTISPLAS